jgi:hypothetical protein
MIKTKYFYMGNYSTGGWCKIIREGFDTEPEAFEYAKRHPFSGEWEILSEEVLEESSDCMCEFCGESCDKLSPDFCEACEKYINKREGK